jgi:hypothetical protein
VNAVLLLVCLDRIEGDWAVVEYGPSRTFEIPVALLPADAREGDTLLLEAHPSPPSAPRLPQRRPQGAVSAAGDRADSREDTSSPRE